MIPPRWETPRDIDQKKILPAHKCFDDALDTLVMLAKDPNEHMKVGMGIWKLAHGICLNEHTKEPYSHAWVEGPDTVWECGIYEGRYLSFEWCKKDFYKERAVQEATKYTYYQAYQENHKHVNYGPWIKKYRELCK